MEREAEPILDPMIVGTETRLTIADQALIATWAAKTAMMMEANVSPARPQHAARTIPTVYIERKPLSGMFVLLARSVGGFDL